MNSLPSCSDPRSVPVLGDESGEMDIVLTTSAAIKPRMSFVDDADAPISLTGYVAEFIIYSPATASRPTAPAATDPVVVLHINTTDELVDRPEAPRISIEPGSSTLCMDLTGEDVDEIIRNDPTALSAAGMQLFLYPEAQPELRVKVAEGRVSSAQSAIAPFVPA